MPLNFGHAVIRHALPQNLPGLFVERINLPGVSWIVFDRRDIAVETKTRFIFRRAHRGANENLVTPDDRTGVAQTRNSGLPNCVNCFSCVKADGGSAAFNNTSC